MADVISASSYNPLNNLITTQQSYPLPHTSVISFRLTPLSSLSVLDKTLPEVKVVTHRGGKRVLELFPLSHGRAATMEYKSKAGGHYQGFRSDPSHDAVYGLY